MTKVNSTVVNEAITKKELPINIALKKRGGKLYIKLNQAPAKVDLFTYRKHLHTFIGRGKAQFNITPYLSKVKNNNITLFAYSTKGIKYQKNFNLSKYSSLLQC